MTAIISVKTNNFAIHLSDRQITNGVYNKLIEFPKIFIKDNIVLGLSGESYGREILEYKWNAPERTNADTDVSYSFKIIESLREFCINYDKDNSPLFTDFELLISYKSQTFKINENYTRISSMKNIVSVGCCSEFIHGSILTQLIDNDMDNLSVEEIIEIMSKSLKIASSVSYGISESYDYIIRYKNGDYSINTIELEKNK